MIIGFMLVGSFLGLFVGLLGWAFGAFGLLAALGVYLGFGVGFAFLGAGMSLIRGVSLPALRPVRLPTQA